MAIHAAIAVNSQLDLITIIGAAFLLCHPLVPLLELSPGAPRPHGSADSLLQSFKLGNLESL